MIISFREPRSSGTIQQSNLRNYEFFIESDRLNVWQLRCGWYWLIIDHTGRKDIRPLTSRGIRYDIHHEVVLVPDPYPS